jgi:MFS family permease
MSNASTSSQPRHEIEHPYWQRNLGVCLFGSFTTIIAMTLLLPYLPLYVERLGVHGQGSIARWSGFAYAATFVTAALSAPLWGRLGDRYGRKSMLVRASIGMAVTTSALGLVHNAEQLVAMRLVVGLAGGYASGSTILVAAQTPKERSAWALGVLSVGTMTGNIVGPLAGGWMPPLIGIRSTFFASGALIAVAAVGTVTFLKEDRRPVTSHASATQPQATVNEKGRLVVLLAAAAMIMFATTSIEPIITLVVRHLDPGATHISGLAGFVFTSAAIGSIISAPRLGKLSDRWGHDKVILASLTASAVLALCQAAANHVWELTVLRFLMGLALGGLLPSVNAAIRRVVPQQIVGRTLGYGVSSQYAGQVLGPVVGGIVATHAPLSAVFVMTAIVLMAVTGLLYGVSTLTKHATG